MTFIKSEAAVKIITIIIKGRQYILRVKLESFPNQSSSKCWHQSKINQLQQHDKQRPGEAPFRKSPLRPGDPGSRLREEALRQVPNPGLGKPAFWAQNTTAKSRFQRADTIKEVLD